jgi:hypothetical protein
MVGTAGADRIGIRANDATVNAVIAVFRNFADFGIAKSLACMGSA